MKLQAEKITLTIAKNRLLDEVGIQVEPGEFVGLIGPNGSGKSTLIKTIYQHLRPDAGWISLDERDLSTLSSRQTAQAMSVVRQESADGGEFTVREIVMMGRYPYKRFLEGDTEKDWEIVVDALDQVGMTRLADQPFMKCSGGEKQRVLIARSLAQQADFLILDEPTNHLDIRYQLQIMDLISEIGVTALAALHDLNIAAAYCDRLFVIESGRMVASGRPEQVLCPELLREVFGVEAEVERHRRTGKIHVLFLSDRPEKSLRA
ncbi:ABC transporter ATP-binding protein [Desmospora profundinema]|uniref:Iron complex transport system ATP-binding protein n=1 Tax=Desmospora profundinema TaxID=1571184 RepID=A0ABU1IRY6_9BACL|nr:ABC transporter ATP-binding protein [Desmospora profundinema]MDR6226679.1 iron complex transport system ATP-binding protein [Desmospora profundinema]